MANDKMEIVSAKRLQLFKELADKKYYSADNPPPATPSVDGVAGLFEIPISLQSYLARQLSSEELQYIKTNIETIKKGAYINLGGVATALLVGTDITSVDGNGAYIYSQLGATALALDYISGEMLIYTLPRSDEGAGKIPQINEDGNGWNYIDPSEIKGSTLTAGEGISIKNSKVAIKTTSENELGGIKTGYIDSGDTYAVQVDSNGNAYVRVPRQGMLVAESQEEMDIIVENTNNIGQVVKYVGETNKYNQDSFYLIEEGN